MASHREDSPVKKKKKKSSDENQRRQCIIHIRDVKDNVTAFSEISWAVSQMLFLLFSKILTSFN